MASVNIVVLAGNLTRDPELRYTPGGTAVADLGLAVNRTYTASGGDRREEVLFVTCVAWGKTAEAASQHLAKGSGVLVEGRLQSRQWERKDGTKQTTIEVVVESLQFLTYKDGGKNGPVRQPGDEARGSVPASAPPADDDVPF